MRFCGRCGRHNPLEANFCSGCGSPLPPLEQSDAPGAQEVRKTVTALFCDVTGSTALGERLDPETLRQVLARYFAAMQHVVEIHGGTVEKFIGDAVMAVFGLPVLHEDDALRAVRAAVGMQAALAELNAELQQEFDTALQIRIGIDTGEVVTGTQERLATGDTVNTAARLEQAAEPGQVLIGQPTLDLVHSAVEVTPLDPLSVKGKAEPLAAYRVIGLRPDGGGRRFDAPLVGRRAELERLTTALSTAIGERTCRLF
ncbi:MAG: guanylate cyclase, partial [Gammaproteobacteria bacterium]|nr:guanylate cyclase [Gammaproteobacteria bacterium]